MHCVRSLVGAIFFSVYLQRGSVVATVHMSRKINKNIQLHIGPIAQ